MTSSAKGLLKFLPLGIVATLALASCSAASSPSTSGDSNALGTMQENALAVCTNDSPPNIVINANGEFEGPEIDVARAIGESLDVEINFLEYAFAGMLPALQAQQCDVIMGSLYVYPEREEIADFVPYLLSGTAVGVSRENPEGVTGLNESLCGTRVAAITGATGAAVTEEESARCVANGEPAIDLTLVDENVNALQQVQIGQVDAIVDTAQMVEFYQGETDGAFEIAGEPFGTIAIGAATLRGNDSLHNAIDNAFTEILENGTYEQILIDNNAVSQDIRNFTND